MCRLAGFVGCLAILVGITASAAEEAAPKHTFRIDLSSLHTMKPQDWSGGAEISRGRIVQVEKTSGSGDTIHPDKSWTLLYGRSLLSNPKQQPIAKALLISVAAPDDAVLTVKTKGGEFSFRLDEVAEGKQLERLGGEVLISLADLNAGGEKRGKKKGKKKSGGATAAPAKIAGELPSEPWTDGKLQSDWPALAVGADGTQWCALVEWNGKDRDRVLVMRQRSGKIVGKPIVLDDDGGDHYWPAIGMASDSAVVVWSSQINGSFGLWWAMIAADGTASRPQPLTNTAHTEFQSRFAGDGKGTLTLVWQSMRNGQSDIYARRFTGGAWGPEVRVSPSAAHDWQPSVAIDSNGSAWISWDSYEHGNYDVYLRRFDAWGLGPVIPITSELTAQFHSSVAIDGKNRVWVAWDDAGPNWGKDLSASAAMPGYKGLHAVRTIGVRVYADGALWQPIQPGTAMSGYMTQYAELPQLAFDGQGTPWLIFRHWSIQRPSEMFHFYAMKLTAQGWSTPWRLADSSGQNTQWTSIARTPEGKLAVLYASDGRSPENLPKDQIHALIYSVHEATLGPGDGMPEVKLAKVELPAATGTFQPRVRPQMTVAGKTYTLMVGDCHRHTDIRGHSGVDASIMDTFRYAYDAAQLDFMGLGDHNEVNGGRWPDGLRDYQWWWTQKAVDLFTCLPTFLGVYSYEHSMDAPAGHRNMLFLKRGAPLRMIDRANHGDEAPDNQPPALWKWVRSEVLTQPGQQCVIVPHTFAAGPLASWNWPNAEFDALLEIYQGCRGSYEQIGLPKEEKRGGTQTTKPGHFAQDALLRGNVYGFVCFSDHRSTHTSWACVWVEQINRASLFQALLSRRTYGASDEMVLKVTADGQHTMGEQFEASAVSPPALNIDVTGADELRRIDIVKNGRHIFTRKLTGQTFQTVFHDFDTKPGRAYYYVRVLQRDPAAPDGDPQIGWTSPMFVTYH